MSKVQIQVQGFVSRDVAVQRTGSGRPVANVTVPHTPRKRGQSGEWEDTGPTTWYEAAIWDDAAEFAGSLMKGDEVVLTGAPNVETYDRRDGGQGVKVSIKFGTVGLVKRAGSRQAGRGGANGAGVDDWAQPQQFDPQAQQQWAAAQPGSAAGFDSEPPF